MVGAVVVVVDSAMLVDDVGWGSVEADGAPDVSDDEHAASAATTPTATKACLDRLVSVAHR